jgi:hypothetical protein
MTAAIVSMRRASLEAKLAAPAIVTWNAPSLIHGLWLYIAPHLPRAKAYRMADARRGSLRRNLIFRQTPVTQGRLPM